MWSPFDELKDAIVDSCYYIFKVKEARRCLFWLLVGALLAYTVWSVDPDIVYAVLLYLGKAAFYIVIGGLVLVLIISPVCKKLCGLDLDDTWEDVYKEKFLRRYVTTSLTVEVMSELKRIDSRLDNDDIIDIVARLVLDNCYGMPHLEGKLGDDFHNVRSAVIVRYKELTGFTTRYDLLSSKSKKHEKCVGEAIWR